MPDARPPLLDQVCTNAVRLPSAPTLMPRLVAALQNEESSASDIEAVIRLDAALAASTLRLANSAYYGGRTVDSVEEAIVRLGQREIYRLATLALTNRWETGQVNALGWQPGDFSRRSLCTALGAEALAEKTGRMDVQTAYTAGLICDLGRLALAHSCAEFYPAVRAYCAEKKVTWEDGERAVLGYDHAVVGAHMLRSWRFPELFVLAVEYQAKPAQSPEPARCLLAHLHAAKHLAAVLGPGVGEDGYLVSIDGPFLEEWGITAELFESAMSIVADRATARLGERLSHGVVKF